jgi:polyisoprenyl-phosphate glycosyltransferase
MPLDLSVVVPVLNERENLPELRRRLTAALEKTGLAWEVIVVDDGGDDDSLGWLRQAHQEDRRWKTLVLSRNFGHGAACTAGLSQCDSDAVVLMDGDLQDPPELIEEMLARWREGAKVVYAVRTDRKESLSRRLLTSFFYRLLEAMSPVSIPLDAGIFCLLDRKAADALASLPERHRYLTGLRAWVGFSQVPIYYKREARRASSPKQDWSRLLRLAMDAFFAFSNIPLRLATLLGLTMAGGSFLFALKVIYEKLFTSKPIIGWSSTLVAITLTGGAILVTLGIIGEYLGRIYDEIKARPIYLVSEKIGF